MPYFYNKGKEDEKTCLTYILSIVYEEETLDIFSIMLSCVPNGKLINTYKDKILNKGKMKGKSARFIYKKAKFSLLKDKPNRYHYLYKKEESIKK